MNLSDRALRLLGWAILAFFVLAFATAIGLKAADEDVFQGWDDVGTWDLFVFPLMPATFAVVGLLITRLQPRNRVGWLLHAVGFTWAVAALFDGWIRLSLHLFPGSVPGGEAVNVIGGALWLPPVVLMGVYVLLLFPDGRIPSRRWRVVAWLAVADAVALLLTFILAPGERADAPVPLATNPLAIPGSETFFSLLAAGALPASRSAYSWPPRPSSSGFDGRPGWSACSSSG